MDINRKKMNMASLRLFKLRQLYRNAYKHKCNIAECYTTFKLFLKKQWLIIIYQPTNCHTVTMKNSLYKNTQINCKIESNLKFIITGSLLV